MVAVNEKKINKWNALLGLGGSVLGKAGGLIGGTLGLGATALAVEQATDNGKGGVIQRLYHNVMKKFTESTSLEQGRNGTIDQYFGGQAQVYGFAGFFKAIFQLIGFKAGEDWIDKNFTGQIDKLDKQAKAFKEKGGVYNNILDPGQKASVDSVISGATAAVGGLTAASATVAYLNSKDPAYQRLKAEGLLNSAIEAASDGNIRKSEKLYNAAEAADTKASKLEAAKAPKAPHLPSPPAPPAIVAGSSSGIKSFFTSTVPSAFKTVGSKLPVVGKYFSIAGAVGGAGIALVASTTDGNAAEIPEAKTVGAPQAVNSVTGIPSIQQTIAPETAPTISPIQSAGADISALGVSALAARPAAATLATAGASLGLKAIPGVAAIVAAGETVLDTTSYAMKGKFTQAGLSLVAGAGSTVAGLGGAFTYATLGTAWHQGVKEIGAYAFGRDNTIEDSTVVQLAKGAANLTGLSSAFNPLGLNLTPAPAPVPARAPVFTPAPRTLEFDMSGAM